MDNKVVIRYRNGRLVKGETGDFAPNRDSFTLTQKREGALPESTKVKLEDLKAIFFVRSHEGSKDHMERKLHEPEGKIGKRLLVTFEDGETIRGTTLGTTLTPHGFLLFPADPQSNNKRIFILRGAVKRIQEEG